MNRNQWLILTAAIVIALGAGWYAGRKTAPETTPDAAASKASPRKVLYYRNPMGLPDTSPVPKKDAMGMDYIAVYEGDAEPSAAGTVVLSPEKVQKLGVRTERVRRRPLAPRLRVSGTVQMDETRQYAIAPRFEGWIERLYANQTGMTVRRGQPLLAVYSPQLLATREEYRVADAAARKLAASDPGSAASMVRLRDAARARLRNWNIGTPQLAHLGHGTGGSMVLTSPADAVVVEKPIVQGARFAPGDTILRLADLSTVWVIASVPASGAQAVEVGQRATFESPTLPGRTFKGQVTFVSPVIDPATRTLGVRVAMPNRDGMLRPGLFGDITLVRDDDSPVLTVPRSAVLDSGTRRIVLVQVADGRFEPREVVVGRRAGDYAEILEGVAEGESVVTAANFLIDAESNLQSALEGLTAHSGHDAAPATSPSDADLSAPSQPSQEASPTPAPTRQPTQHRHTPVPPSPTRGEHDTAPAPVNEHGGHGTPAAAAPHAHAGHTGH